MADRTCSTDGCGQEPVADGLGWCAAHWDRLIVGQALLESVIIGRSGECWEWDGPVRSDGYGLLTVIKDGQRLSGRAHRVSWTFHVGPIPDGLYVCHTCDNPPCTNPTHLWLGSHADNMADKVAKGRQARGGRRRWVGSR